MTLAVLAMVWVPVGGALADSRPNIILMLADDLGYGDLGCYGEEHDVSDEHPEIVRRIEHIIQAAVTPSPRYRVGELYRGQPLWQKH